MKLSRPYPVAAILLTFIVGLAVDVHVGIVGQTLIGVASWALLFRLLADAEPELRRSLMACLVIATAGEMFLSLAWGLYTYRLDNIPLFIPPGHALLLLLGRLLAQRLPAFAVHAILGGAALYALAVASAGIDTLALPLLLLMAAASFALPRQRALYASTFVLSLALELYGTWLGSWTWATEVPVLPLVTTNPPGLAGAFYCALDALVVTTALLLPVASDRPASAAAPASTRAS